MADSLFFDGVNDILNFSMGQFAATGARTQAIILKRDTTDTAAFKNLIRFNGTEQGGIAVDDTDVLFAYDNAQNSYAGLIFDQTYDWMLVVETKAAGEDVGRQHTYRWYTAAWAHLAGVTNISNGSAPSGVMILETTFKGYALIAGVWDSQLSDGEIQTLINGQQAWYDLSPKEAWRLNTLSAISTFASGGTSTEASRTGTTVATGDVPSGWADITVAPGTVRSVTSYPRLRW